MIHVSDLSRHEFCPRIVYLTKVLGLKPTANAEHSSGFVGHAIRKELSLRQAKVLGKISDASELEKTLSAELDAIISDVPYIYREKLDGIDYQKYLPELKPQLNAEIKKISRNLSSMIDEIGLEETIKTNTPWKIEHTVRSEKLNLSGRVDKIMREDTIAPVEIKSKSPSDSVWDGDRIQVCAYAILLEEAFGENIPFGFVEYTKIQAKRPVLASEKLRRRVLSVRDEVALILDGRVPDICSHGSGRRCESCGLMKECYRI